MNVRLIFAACIFGVVTLSVQADLAATETRAAKSEAVPPTSLKFDPPSVPAKPSGSIGDPKTGERSKSPANGGPVHQPAVLAAAFPEIIGKDSAPMVLVPGGEFVMGSDKGDEDEAPVESGGTDRVRSPHDCPKGKEEQRQHHRPAGACVSEM